MWEVFDKLCKERGVSAYRVGEETGIKTSALSAWKAGRYKFKQEKLQKIADYFGVSLEYMMTGEEKEVDRYYVNPDAAEMAQQIYENKDLRLLFDVAKGVTPEQLRLLHDLAMSWKKSE